VILMTDETPTIEDLQKTIEILEQELDEMAGKVDRLEKVEKACQDMAQKLADKFKDSLSDWWWPV